MLRAPLDELLLHAAALGAASPAALLARAPTPPPHADVALALGRLVGLQALRRVDGSTAAGARGG